MASSKPNKFERQELERAKQEERRKALIEGIEFPSEELQALYSFTPEIVAAFLENLQSGLDIEDCAKVLGVPVSKVKQWYREDFCGICIHIDKSLALNKRHHVMRIFNANDATKVKASTWWLERKHKKEFSKEVTHKVNHVIADSSMRILAEVMVEFIKDPEILQLAKQRMRDKFLQLRLEEPEAVSVEPILIEDSETESKDVEKEL